MTTVPVIETWLREYERLAPELAKEIDTYLAVWRCYRDGLTPAEAVAAIIETRAE